MYHQISRLLCCVLIFSTACQSERTDQAFRLLNPGEKTDELLATDDQERYFESVTPFDRRLQLPAALDTTENDSSYRQWLQSLEIPWPPELKEKVGDLYAEAHRSVTRQFPGLLPDSVYLVLLNDRPYGSYVYFTRNNAIFLPVTDVREARHHYLSRTLYHELFHLISRTRPELRTELYAIANFEPLTSPLQLDALAEKKLLTNPDAPRMDYLLTVDGERYLPVLFAGDTMTTHFEEALDFAYFRTVAGNGDTLVVTPRRLAEHRVVEATEANSYYLIHPEEILAEHFALLFTADAGALTYPAELKALKELLLRASRP